MGVGCGQWVKNMVRASLLGQVHRRHSGAPSSSEEGRRRDGHHISSHLFIFVFLYSLGTDGK